MKNANVTLRVDDDLKKQAEELFSELGLNLTTAFNVFSGSLSVSSGFLFR